MAAGAVANREVEIEKVGRSLPLIYFSGFLNQRLKITLEMFSEKIT